MTVDQPDDDRFAAFYVAEQPRLAGYCRRLLGDDAAAWDVAQEALVRTWTAWPRVTDPHAYCYLIAVNLVRRAWREEARRRRRLPELVDRPGHGQEIADRHSVRDLVEGLPRRLRVPTLLHYWVDLPATEIARLLKAPEGTVRRRLSEARTLLAARIEEVNRV